LFGHTLPKASGGSQSCRFLATQINLPNRMRPTAAMTDRKIRHPKPLLSWLKYNSARNL
jgi:hypothetical protein